MNREGEEEEEEGGQGMPKLNHWLNCQKTQIKSTIYLFIVLIWLIDTFCMIKWFWKTKTSLSFLIFKCSINQGKFSWERLNFDRIKLTEENYLLETRILQYILLFLENGKLCYNCFFGIPFNFQVFDPLLLLILLLLLLLILTV